jgi:zinc transport system ATP-binding protein
VVRNVKNIACVNRHVHYHAASEVTGEMLGEAFGCPFEMVAHGHVPHRILSDHAEG